MGEGDQVLRRQGGVSSNSRIEGSFQVFSVFARRQCSFLHGGILERDDFSLNRHPALSLFKHDLSGKPAPLFLIML